MMGKPITNQEIKAIKKLLDARVTNKDIAEIMGLSVRTVSRVACGDLPIKKDKKVIAKEQTVTKAEKVELNQNEKTLLGRLDELIFLQKETNVLLKELAIMYRYE